MSWIAEYDTQGREFPTCVHVTKTTGTMTHGATYVPIEDGKAVRVENAKLRELVRDMCDFYCVVPDEPHVFKEKLDFIVEVWRRMRELGIEANE